MSRCPKGLAPGTGRPIVGPMSRPDSAGGAQVVRLGVPHALRDKRLSGMSAEELLPTPPTSRPRLGAALGPRAAPRCARGRVTAPAHRSRAAAPYSQAGLALAMRAAQRRGAGLARPPSRTSRTATPCAPWWPCCSPNCRRSWTEARDLERGRKRWAAARIDYPGIDPRSPGPATDLIMRGEPWERAFLSTLSRRAGIPELPLFVMDVFRRWRPDATDVRTVLPALAWLGPERCRVRSASGRTAGRPREACLRRALGRRQRPRRDRCGGDGRLKPLAPVFSRQAPSSRQRAVTRFVQVPTSEPSLRSSSSLAGPRTVRLRMPETEP